MRTAADAFGGLDVLLNNAGIIRIGMMADVSLDDYPVINVNQVGCWLGMKTTSAVMRSGGSIVNISSMNGSCRGRAYQGTRWPGCPSRGSASPRK